MATLKSFLLKRGDYMFNQILDNLSRSVPVALFFVDALLIGYFLDQVIDYILNKKKVKNEKKLVFLFSMFLLLGFMIPFITKASGDELIIPGVEIVWNFLYERCMVLIIR